MGILVFSLAALLSLPKQFIIVYLGVALEQASNGKSGVPSRGPPLTTTPGEKSSTKDKVLKYSIIGITLVITVWAMWYIYAQMGKVKVEVIYARRKARLGRSHHSETPHLTMSFRQVKTAELGSDALSHSAVDLTPHPMQPFIPGGTSGGRSWDERRSVIGWSDNPSLETTNHTAQPTVHEGRDSLAHGGDFMARRHHDAAHPAGPSMHGREVLVNPFDPHQHLRTRSLSGFHRNTDDPDTFRTAVTNH